MCPSVIPGRFPNAPLVVLTVAGAALLGSAGEVAARQPCIGWTERTDVTTDWPLARGAAAMTYDGLHGQTLVVGGYRGGNLDETWGWDGREWALLPSGSFIARRSHSVVYDTARDTAVLFGGYGERDLLGDTWERGPSGVWTLAASTGPSPRYTAMAYDERRGVTVLFGGYSPDTRELGDTWEWDGATWVQVADTGPSRRSSHAMAYDSRRGVTVLHGGYGSSGRQADTWEWDGITWALVEEGGLGARSGARMTYDEQRGYSLLCGGQDDSLRRLDDLWAWDGRQWTQLSPSGPGSDLAGAMTYDTARGIAVLFGGFERGRTVWEWDGQEWTQHPPPDIGVSEEHCMAYDSHRGKVYLFGGRTDDGFSGKTWEWNGEEWTLVSESGPSPRAGARMVFDSFRNVTVLFGGGGEAGRLADTWEWDGSQWTQVDAFGPEARSQHMMAFDSRRGEVVLYGGRYTRDTWIYFNGRWRFVTNRGPQSRYGAAMVYDPLGDNIVLYGGAREDFEGTIILAGTWILDTNGWRQVADASPGPLAFQAATFDSHSGVVLMHGGQYLQYYGALRDALWKWNGSRWTLLTQEGPTPRQGHSMAYDQANHQTLLFGGFDNQPGQRGDTWTYGHIVNPSLTLDTSCPQSGPAVVTWSCATPGGTVGLAFSPRLGSFQIPPGQPCAGTWISLHPQGMQLLGLARSNNQGGGTINGNLPARACGGYLQLLDATTCATSAAVRIE